MRSEISTIRWGHNTMMALGMMLPLVAACSPHTIDQPPPSPPSSPPAPPPPLPPPPPGQVTATITVDTTVRFQRMAGWEATDQAGQEEPGFSAWQGSVMEQAAELGIDRIRLELRAGAESPVDNWSRWRNGSISEAEWRGLRYRPINDDANPTSANPSGFQFAELDDHVRTVLLPLRAAVEAQGRELQINLNYVGFGSNTQVHQDPAEYAEFILEAFLHLKAVFDLVPDAVEPILEPDNSTLFDAQDVAAVIVATGDRLAAAGFHPEFIAPSTMSMARAPTWFDQMATTPRLFLYFKEYSYHRYAGVSEANLRAIRSRAESKGLRTAMLEHIGSDVEDLYDDLTIANASAWQQYTLAYPGSDNGGKYFPIVNDRPVMGSRTRALAQYFRYVRRGGYRVHAVSTAESVRPVGFTNPSGGPVVILHLSSPESLLVRGLRPGRYLVTSSDPQSPVLGEATVGAGGELRFSTRAIGVLTIAFQQ